MKHLLLFAIIVAFAVITIVVQRLKSDTKTTISLNAAKHPAAFLIIAISVSISLVLASIYYIDWFQPEYQLGAVSTILFAGIILSFGVTSWVPDSSGWMRSLHRGAAYAAIFIMPLFLLTLLTVSLPNIVAIVTVLAVSALFFMLYLFFFVPKARQWFLLFQGLYLAIFFIVLVFITYLK